MDFSTISTNLHPFGLLIAWVTGLPLRHGCWDRIRGLSQWCKCRHTYYIMHMVEVYVLYIHYELHQTYINILSTSQKKYPRPANEERERERRCEQKIKNKLQPKVSDFPKFCFLFLSLYEIMHGNKLTKGTPTAPNPRSSRDAHHIPDLGPKKSEVGG